MWSPSCAEVGVTIWLVTPGAGRLALGTASVSPSSLSPEPCRPQGLGEHRALPGTKPLGDKKGQVVGCLPGKGLTLLTAGSAGQGRQGIGQALWGSCGSRLKPPASRRVAAPGAPCAALLPRVAQRETQSRPCLAHPRQCRLAGRMAPWSPGVRAVGPRGTHSFLCVHSLSHRPLSLWSLLRHPFIQEAFPGFLVLNMPWGAVPLWHSHISLALVLPS